MKLADPFVQELSHEAKATRKCLERVPADKFGWKPHEKSMTMGRLASHVAEIPSWTMTTINEEEFRMERGKFAAYEAKSTDEMLKTFDDNIKNATDALKGVDDKRFLANWRMYMDGNPIIDMPRMAVVRSWVIDHLIHHRGQLTVYLRLNDIAVPAIYGPSADEQG